MYGNGDHFPAATMASLQLESEVTGQAERIQVMSNPTQAVISEDAHEERDEDDEEEDKQERFIVFKIPLQSAIYGDDDDDEEDQYDPVDICDQKNACDFGPAYDNVGVICVDDINGKYLSGDRNAAEVIHTRNIIARTPAVSRPHSCTYKHDNLINPANNMINFNSSNNNNRIDTNGYPATEPYFTAAVNRDQQSRELQRNRNKAKRRSSTVFSITAQQVTGCLMGNDLKRTLDRHFKKKEHARSSNATTENNNNKDDDDDISTGTRANFTVNVEDDDALQRVDVSAVDIDYKVYGGNDENNIAGKSNEVMPPTMNFFTLSNRQSVEPNTMVSKANTAIASRPTLSLTSKQSLNRVKVKVINGHLFGPVIGEGSYSKVKECIDTTTLCHRAVKIMKFRQLRRLPNAEDIAKREVEVLRKLTHHPNIIRLHSFLEDRVVKQKLYLFLDFALCSLQDMMDDWGRPFPAWQLHRYFKQVIDGMEHIHSHHIVHNDIKPGNLLLTVDGVIKICDFGSAEIMEPFDQQGIITRCRGTPAFQAPEVANGHDYYDARKLDVWSTGVSLYALSFGKLPFRADNVYLMFKVVGQANYTIPDEADDALRTLLQGMMCIRSQDRFGIEQVRASDWFQKKHPYTKIDAVPCTSKTAVNRGPYSMMQYLSACNQYVVGTGSLCSRMSIRNPLTNTAASKPELHWIENSDCHGDDSCGTNPIASHAVGKTSRATTFSHRNMSHDSTSMQQNQHRKRMLRRKHSACRVA